jgi:hypothetical protein
MLKARVGHGGGASVVRVHQACLVRAGGAVWVVGGLGAGGDVVVGENMGQAAVQGDPALSPQGRGRRVGRTARGVGGRGQLLPAGRVQAGGELLQSPLQLGDLCGLRLLALPRWRGRLRGARLVEPVASACRPS